MQGSILSFLLCFFLVWPLDKLRAPHRLQGPNFAQINAFSLLLAGPVEENVGLSQWGTAPH